MNRCLSGKIASALREELAAGCYRVGERLPDVDALRARFGAGEFAVRHALQMLRDEGFITLKSHVGAVATDSLARTWKGHVAFVHTSRRSAYFVSRLSVVLGERLESAGLCYHPVFTAAAKDGSIDTSSIERHIANGLDFAIVYSEFKQIAGLFDRAGVPYIVLNGFTTVIDGVTGLGGSENKAESIRVTRTMLASLLVHEVRPTWRQGGDAKTIVDTMNILMDFGIAADDCSYTAYWDAANPVACSAKDVYVSVYRRGGKLLAVCGSWADGDRDVELTLKRGVLANAKNAETGESIPVSDGSVRFTVKKHDLNLVECEIGKEDVP